MGGNKTQSAMAGRLYPDLQTNGGQARQGGQGGNAPESQRGKSATSNEQMSGQQSPQPEDQHEDGHLSPYADDQPVDKDTAREYGLSPGTTWRILSLHKKLKSLDRKVMDGTATRADALGFFHEVLKLKEEGNLSVREQQNVHSMVMAAINAAHPKGIMSFDDVTKNRLFWDAARNVRDYGQQQKK